MAENGPVQRSIGRLIGTEKRTVAALQHDVRRPFADRARHPLQCKGQRISKVVIVRIGAIVVHCHEFDRMLEFWQSALGYEPREPASGGWVVLHDPTGSGPNLSLQARDRPSGRRSWLHLDLYTDDRDGEVERLVALGARRYPWRSRPNADFVVLEDPDGNLFCVVQKSE